MVTRTAIDIISDLTGVLKVLELSVEDRDAINEIECGREKDLIPVVNKGLNECLTRDVCLLVIKNTKLSGMPTFSDDMLLVTDKGRVLGKLLAPEEIEEYQGRDDVYFLSKDFILFKSDKNVINSGQEKQFFLIPSAEFPEIEGIEGIADVVASSPSKTSYAYMGDKYGYGSDSDTATLIVAFNKKE